MADIAIRDLDPKIVELYRQRARMSGHTLEEEIRRALHDHVRRDRDTWVEELRAFRERMKAQYGVMPDSTPIIREMRDERG